MTVRTYAATALLASGSWLAIGLSTPAFAVCDAYSGGCPTTPPSDIGGETENPGSGGGSETGGDTENPTTGGGTAGGGTTAGGTTGGTATSPSTLPFTGGELVLMTAIGAGALAGGTALVLAGRRKAAATA